MGTISIVNDINTLCDRLEASKEATVNARLHRIEELTAKKHYLQKGKELALENIRLTEIQVEDLSKDLDVRNGQCDRLNQTVDLLHQECDNIRTRINTTKTEISQLRTKFQDESALYRSYLGVEVHLSNSDRVVIRLSNFFTPPSDDDDNYDDDDNQSMTIIALKEISSDALGLIVEAADPCILGFEKLADSVNDRSISFAQFVATCRELFARRLRRSLKSSVPALGRPQ